MDEEKTVVETEETRNSADIPELPPVKVRTCKKCGAPLPSNLRGNICLRCSRR